MEEGQTSSLAIPPGVVPSESREDLYKQLGLEERDTKDQFIADREQSTAALEPAATTTDSPVEEIAVVTRCETPSTAWPAHDTPTDLVGAKQTPPPVLSSTENTSDGLLQDVLKRCDQGHGEASSVKRPQSPLRKYNKVAPLDVTKTVSAAGSKPLVGSSLMAAAFLPAQTTLDAYVPLDGDSDTVIANTSGLEGNQTATEPHTGAASNVSVASTAIYSKVIKVNSASSGDASEQTEANQMEKKQPKQQHSSTQNMPTQFTSASAVVKHKATIEDDTDGDQYATVNEPKILQNSKPTKQHDVVEGNVQLISVGSVPDADISSQPAQFFPTNSSGDMQPLHYAASTGDKKKLAELISQVQDEQSMAALNATVDVRDSEGRTPLLHAVHNEHLACMKMLLEAGADINVRSNDGSTPLHHAAYSSSHDMLALLLSLGADGTASDSNGRYPIHWVTNNDDVRCTQLLLDKVPGANVNIRDGTMMTPLMWAAFHGRPEHVKLLKQNGADASLVDIDGMYAIHWAIHRHETGTLKELINAKATRYQDNKGRTVMHVAAVEGCAKEVNLIKSIRPTSVQDIDNQSRTPLHWAAASDNPDVIKALLAAEANANIKDASGYTPMDYAMEKQLHYCALLLSKSQGGCQIGPDQESVLVRSYGNAASPVDQLDSAYADEQTVQIRKSTLLKSLSAGCWMYKFTENGKGPIHLRFFTVLLASQKLCWAKSAEAADKDIKSDRLLNVRSSVSPLVQCRKDFDPVVKHRYAFTILTTHKVINVVAVSSQDYKLWVNGLQLLLEIGSDHAIQIAMQDC